MRSDVGRFRRFSLTVSARICSRCQEIWTIRWSCLATLSCRCRLFLLDHRRNPVHATGPVKFYFTHRILSTIDFLPDVDRWSYARPGDDVPRDLPLATSIHTAAFLVFYKIPKRRSKAIAFLLGTWCIVLAWTARNVIVLGDSILVAVGSGSVFMQGSDEKVFTIAGKAQWYPLMYQAASDQGILKSADNKESISDANMFAIGLLNYRKRWQTAPFSFIPLFLKKTLRLWYATESGGFTQQIILGCGSLAIVPLGFWGLWRWASEQPLTACLFSWIIAYFVIVHVVTSLCIDIFTLFFH